jgi:aminomethyltransferase
VSVGTAFHPRTSVLNKKLAWGEWAGYFAAAVYADFHDIEYNAIREAAAVIDVSPLYKYIVRGRDATKLLDRVITRDAKKIAVDQVIYTPWCDERGKVIDDGTVTRLDDTTYRWTAADPSYRWFELNATGLDVSIEDVSETLAALALQGPKSRDVLEAATEASWADVRYFRRRPTEIRGFDVDVTRTGYTGDLGYELWVDADHAVDLWDAIFAAGDAFGVRAAGIQALDVARVEAGLILIEVDYTSARHAIIPEQEYSPFELGLGRLVDLSKTTFVGKQALQAEHAAGGPPRRLVGLEIEWEGIESMFGAQDLPPVVSPTVSRVPVPLYGSGGQQVGRVTSSTWGPTLKTMIALGSVDARQARTGNRLQVEWTVEARRGRVGATVVDLPFFDPPRKRS